MDLQSTLSPYRIVLCVGSGGVGKTTTAAALALGLAREGRQVLVLTIDPARRLANSLGLHELGHDVVQVPANIAGTKGALWAMMLDQQRAFDDMVRRHARDPIAVARILANPVYKQISGSLAGAHEYAAISQLGEFATDHRWDLIVVDTPPTAHALDFLDAPNKLAAAIDSPAIDWFRKLQSERGWSLIGRTGKVIIDRIAKFVGSQFLQDLSVFFTEFNDVLGGFRGRADEAIQLLARPDVGFIIVSSPEAANVRECTELVSRLRSAKLLGLALILNKVHAVPSMTLTPSAARVALEAAPGVGALGLSGTSLGMVAEALSETLSDIDRQARADHAAATILANLGLPIVQMPMLPTDVHNAERLTQVANLLLRAPTA